jgi:hypothetical protein
MASNLPPGCRESDIPGNRPEDIAHEKLVDEIESALKPLTYQSSDEFERVTNDIVKLYNRAFEEGYQQACSDAAESKLMEGDQG